MENNTVSMSRSSRILMITTFFGVLALLLIGSITVNQVTNIREELRVNNESIAYGTGIREGYSMGLNENNQTNVESFIFDEGYLQCIQDVNQQLASQGQNNEVPNM